MIINTSPKGVPALWTRAFFAGVVSLLVAGCEREEVTHARVAKTPPPASASDAGAMPPMAAPGGMSGEVPPPPVPSGADALAWTLPNGWIESKASGGMRYATLKPPVEGKIDVSVITLPGPAGGELANVNRWRGQIGLAPIDDAALAKARATVKAPAGTANLYDFTSEGPNPSRMVAALLVTTRNSWFIKMVGDPGPVASARADFIELLETLRLGAN
jgi:hypothetical protein